MSSIRPLSSGNGPQNGPGSARVRSADELILPEVLQTIANLDLEDEDSAAARLACRYASVIDAAPPSAAARVLAQLGPKLLAALEALGASPRARAALSRDTPPEAPGRLAALRTARQA